MVQLVTTVRKAAATSQRPSRVGIGCSMKHSSPLPDLLSSILFL